MVKIPQTESIVTNLENSWLTISFNRPEKRNALSRQLIMDIFQIIKIGSHARLRKFLKLSKDQGALTYSGVNKPVIVSPKKTTENRMIIKASKKFGMAKPR